MVKEAYEPLCLLPRFWGSLAWLAEGSVEVSLSNNLLVLGFMLSARTTPHTTQFSLMLVIEDL